MKLKSILCTFLCATLILGSLISCIPQKEPEPQSESYYQFFDTVSAIFSYAGDSEEVFKENAKAVSSLLSEYHKLFDIYYEYDGINNLRTLNKNAGKEPIKLDAKLIDFLLYCKEMYTITGGKTNIAMGSVLKLWHDAREEGLDEPENAKLPDSKMLQDASLHTDINSLIIDKAAGTVLISDPKVQLDVGAIAKGYAAEKAAELLKERGATSYVLNIGGNICAIGEKTGGEGWTIGITNPDKTSDEAFACKVKIKNTSLVTSGDYERFYTVDGKRYHHIIDPETLMPSDYFSSVSVFVSDSGLADVLSTALFCMSYEDGLALAEKLGAEVIWVRQNGELLMTGGVEIVKN